MPVLADPDAPPRGRLLVDDRGRRIARFTYDDRGGRPWADLLVLEPGVDVATAADAVRRDLGGHRVAGPPVLGRALVAAGATPRRHGHVMRHALAHVREPPAPPPGLRLTPMDRPVQDLIASSMAAYPPGHWDFEPGDDDPGHVAERMRRIVGGEEVGPMIPALSRLAVDADGRVQGGAIVTRSTDARPLDGPWLADLWRAPGHRGAGAALLGAVLSAAAATGEPGVGLVVTDGNPARRLYERAGFARVVEAFNVDVPLQPPEARHDGGPPGDGTSG
jgi:GNAT superfamily N-acetyltransferase